MLAALSDYVDGELDPESCQAFREHLAGCNPCEIVVDNIRQTITVYKSGEPIELPAKLHRQLSEVLRQRWREKFPDHGPKPT
jgi:anti-sigma factor RsiW